MEYIAIVITIINCILGISVFVSNKKKDVVQDTKENHQPLIEYQLKELKDDVKQILLKLDKYDKDIDERIDKALDLHIKMYHSKGE